MKKAFAVHFLFGARQRYLFAVRFWYGAQESFFSYICPPKPEIQLPLKTNSSHFEIFSTL
jgi:hypothetical protein